MSNPNPTSLSKNAKLAEVVGVCKTARAEVSRNLTDLYHTFAKNDQFNGFHRTYQPMVEGGEKLPPETKLIERDAKAMLQQVRDNLTREIDLEARREEANTKARADITVGDEVLVAQVPVTVLMPLEKHLRALHAEIIKLPVLNPAVSWSWDAEQEMWRGQPEVASRTKKEPVVITKAPATDKHPAQTELIYEERPIGHYTRVLTSRAVTAAQKRAMAERCSLLADAVKAALERANATPAPPVPQVAEKLLDFVFVA